MNHYPLKKKYLSKDFDEQDKSKNGDEREPGNGIGDAGIKVQGFTV